MRRIVLFVVACLALPSLGFAQKSDDRIPTVTPPSNPGTVSPQPGRGTPVSGQVTLGESAPDFELEATVGPRVKLSALRGDFIVVLFADRRARLADLDALAKNLRPRGVQVVAVVHENLQALQSYTKRAATPYHALADPTGEIAALYGLWDSLHTAVRPGVALVDRGGLVRFMLGGQELPAAEVETLVQFALEGL